jgi:hypothetical protein
MHNPYDESIRNDTAKHYKEIRRILRGNMAEIEPEPPKMRHYWVGGAFLVALLALMIIFLLNGCAQAYSLDKWVDNIRITEGIHSKYQYGIKSIHYKGALEARNICKRTVLHAWRDFRGNRNDLRGFVGFLADRYCPKSADFAGNIRWKKNMYILMTKKGGKNAVYL